MLVIVVFERFRRSMVSILSSALTWKAKWPKMIGVDTPN